ncbi:MAG: hypothetical protein AAFU41_03295 [Pseudomonadota bacterium]
MVRFYYALSLVAAMGWLGAILIAFDEELFVARGTVGPLLWLFLFLVVCCSFVLIGLQFRALTNQSDEKRFGGQVVLPWLMLVPTTVFAVLLFFDLNDLDRLLRPQVVSESTTANTPSAIDQRQDEVFDFEVPVIVEVDSFYDRWSAAVAWTLIVGLVLVFYHAIQVRRIMAGAGGFSFERYPPAGWKDLSVDPATLLVANSLIVRSNVHRLRAAFILILIIGLIGLGVQLYFTAGQLISSDIRDSPLAETRALADRLALEEDDTLRQQRLNTDERESIYAELIAIGVNFSEPFDDSSGFVFGDGDCTFDRSAFSRNTENWFFRNLRQDETETPASRLPCRASEGIQRRLSDARRLLSANEVLGVRLKSIEDTQNGVRNFIEKSLPTLLGVNDNDESFAVEQLVASGVTRFGILFVIIYLVQILVGIYRYSMRQAEYFESAAGALLMSVTRDDPFSEWRDELISSTIDFGKGPTSPTSAISGVVTRGWLGRRNPPQTE